MQTDNQTGTEIGRAQAYRQIAHWRCFDMRYIKCNVQTL